MRRIRPLELASLHRRPDVGYREYAANMTLSEEATQIRRALAGALGVDLDVADDYPLPDYISDADLDTNDDPDALSDGDGERNPIPGYQPSVMVFDLTDLPEQHTGHGAIAWVAWLEGHGWIHTAHDIGAQLCARPEYGADSARWTDLDVAEGTSPVQVASAVAAVIATARENAPVRSG